MKISDLTKQEFFDMLIEFMDVYPNRFMYGDMLEALEEFFTETGMEFEDN